MKPVEYVFTIDAFTPDTLPMGRLAEYLLALSKLIGHRDHTHFVKVDRGSARLVHKVDAVDAPKVEARLDSIRGGRAGPDLEAVRRNLDDLLANDNAVGSLIEQHSGKVVIPFQGRNRPKPITFPAFREAATIQGQIVRIGGRDSTAHAILQDGDITHSNINMSREIAKDLAPLLYGPFVRLHGIGSFERQSDGKWKIIDFKVDRFQKLIDQDVSETLAEIRLIQGNDLMSDDAYSASRSFTSGDAGDGA